MHVNGNQLGASRWAQNAKDQAQTDQDLSTRQGVQAGNGLKPAFFSENGTRPYFSLGNGSAGAGNNQMFETLAEAIEAMGLTLDKEVELDDPSLVTDYGNDADGNPIPLPNGEYVDIDGEMFVDGASLTDVQQGYIGNCYLMAALASLAEHDPQFIENLITDNGDGTYTVHFQGDLGDVTIDDDFPVYAGTENTIYAETDTDGTGGTPELWVAIVEKAYAQAHGGYQDTVGGWAHEALNEITGQDFTTGATTDFSPEELQAALDNGQSVTASSLTKADAKKADLGTGIISNHAYVVTDVRQNKDGEWEVVVYNPWGSDRDTGDGNNDGFTTLTLEEFNDNFRGAAVMDEPLEDAA